MPTKRAGGVPGQAGVDFKALEAAAPGHLVATSALLECLRFDAQGLIPCIAQQFDSGAVLMMAWMNRDSLQSTLETGHMCYWSRSRSSLWRKGESSGQVQALRELRVDCDGDALLALVDQQGPACHSGRRSCFYVQIGSERSEVVTAPLISPEVLYGRG